MRVSEVKKGDAAERGLVMMCVTGTTDQLDKFEKLTSYTSTKCRDESTKEDHYEDFYIVARSDVDSFKAEFKKLKKVV